MADKTEEERRRRRLEKQRAAPAQAAGREGEETDARSVMISGASFCISRSRRTCGSTGRPKRWSSSTIWSSGWSPRVLIAQRPTGSSAKS